MTAFVVAGVSIVSGAGAAFADDSCPLPLLPCGVQDRGLELPDLKLPELPLPLPSGQADEPDPRDTHAEDGPPQQDGKPEDRPWKPVDEDEHRVPEGHPETGGGGLAQGSVVWPFTVGGTALLAGVGLTGVAVRRRKTDA
ncbi:MAG: hypothetical protein HOY71_14255 [Nonomuraea sp.]|nr:hypothetical protein [Nonomuraea sp.]